MIKYFTLIKVRYLLIILLFIFLSGCVTSPPENPNNICRIFRQYPKWYWAAEKVRDKWSLPINVLMAIMYQESSYVAKAKPPRRHLLWIIPWFRPTSAYGYSQAIDGTWNTYKRSTRNSGADRDSFADAADFIGWYSDVAHRKLGISKWDADKVYLAYHEGTGNYARGTYWRKQWLLAVAKKVARRSWIYKVQLQGCEASLPQKPWWHLW